MKKFLLRLLIVVIFLPGLWCLLFIVPAFNFIGLHIVIALFIGIGSFEVSNFFKKAGIPTFGISAPVLSATLVPIVYIEQYLFKVQSAGLIWFVLILCFFVIRTCFPLTRKDFSKTIATVSSSVFTVVYPGLFSIFIVRILSYAHADYVFLFFLLLVFINEIAAYVFGKLAGGRTCLNLPMSPKKTLVGFISGFIFTVGAACVFYAFFPHIFHANIIAVIGVAAVIAIAGILGDLFESALKRSCGLKDSGTIMAGRGGIMDTIDSMLLSAPLFYYLYGLID
jgi:phosphatidate cytidylyltransferase